MKKFTIYWAGPDSVGIYTMWADDYATAKRLFTTSHPTLKIDRVE